MNTINHMKAKKIKTLPIVIVTAPALTTFASIMDGLMPQITKNSYSMIKPIIRADVP